MKEESMSELVAWWYEFNVELGESRSKEEVAMRWKKKIIDGVFALTGTESLVVIIFRWTSIQHESSHLFNRPYQALVTSSNVSLDVAIWITNANLQVTETS